MDKVDWENAPSDAEACLYGVFVKWSSTSEFEFIEGCWVETNKDWTLDSYSDEFRRSRIEMRPDEWTKGAERMEPIVQNGNDGEHYAELEGIDKTLNERGCRYGEFYDNSRVAQELKRVMKSGKNTDDLRDIQREALEVIASKIARIVNGDPDYIDNWHDIIGYAKLVEIELEKEQGE